MPTSPLCSPAVSADPALQAQVPPQLLGSRIVVVSDFNCPYCFTLNEWLHDLGLDERVRWLGVEHKPHLPHGFEQRNHPDDLSTLQGEVADVGRRAPEVGVALPPGWVNSRRALLLQAALEDEQPHVAPRVRRAIFRRFWIEGRNIASALELSDCLASAGVSLADDLFVDEEQLAAITRWWAVALDRIPCMLAPTGARHLGLQDRRAVEAFVLGALQEPPPAEGCR